MESGPRIHFTRGGRQMAVQPPIVGDYCFMLSCSSWCKNIDYECYRCRGRFCAFHLDSHMKRYAVPRDSWRTTRRNFRIRQADYISKRGADAYRALRYLVGSWCKTPGGRRATAPCGHESTACSGDLLGCLRCKFTYCTKHFQGHVVRYAWPRLVVLKVHRQYAAQLDDIAQGKRRLLRIHIPSTWTWDR
jgi:hypothetical protein